MGSKGKFTVYNVQLKANIVLKLCSKKTSGILRKITDNYNRE